MEPDGAVGGGRSLVALLARHWPLLLAVTVVFGAGGYLISAAEATQYTSSATLLLNDPSDSSVFSEQNKVVVDPSRYVIGQADYVTSSPVLAVASTLMHGRLSPAQLRARVSAQASDTVNQLTVTGTDATGSGAAEVANDVSRAYRQVVRQSLEANAKQTTDELDRSVSTLQSRVDGLDQQISKEGSTSDPGLSSAREVAAEQLLTVQSRADEITVDTANFGDGVQLFEAAEVPTSPSRPRPLGATLIGALLGFLLGSAVVWWRGEYRRRADERQDPALVLGVPLLGDVPEFVASTDGRPLPTAFEPYSPAAEAYNLLVESIGFALNAEGGRVIAVTSPGPGDGKTVTTMNLAIAMARDDRRVAVVDGDGRMRGLTRLAAVAQEPGLADLGGARPIEEALHSLEVDGAEALDVVPAGAPLDDPASFFRTSRFRRAVGQLREHADIVIVDSPPLLAVSDAAAIAGQADAVVLVIGRGTPMRILSDVRDRLDFVGTPVLGYVFNRSVIPGSRYGRYGRYAASHGYGYGYGYGAHARHRPRPEAVPARPGGAAAVPGQHAEDEARAEASR